MNTLSIKDIKTGVKELYLGEKFVGDILLLEDGFFEWFPETDNGGYIPTWFLRAVADKVDELNKEWQAEVDKI